MSKTIKVILPSWSALGTGTGCNNVVYAIYAYNLENVFVGGSFTSADGVANTKYIAKWNGTTWSALGTGCNTTVFAIYAYDLENVFVGGYFTYADGVANTKYIAKYSS